MIDTSQGYTTRSTQPVSHSLWHLHVSKLQSSHFCPKVLIGLKLLLGVGSRGGVLKSLRLTYADITLELRMGSQPYVLHRRPILIWRPCESVPTGNKQAFSADCGETASSVAGPAVPVEIPGGFVASCKLQRTRRFRVCFTSMMLLSSV